MVHNPEYVPRWEFNRAVSRLAKRIESLARRHARLAKQVRNLSTSRNHYYSKTKPKHTKLTVQKAVQVVLKELGFRSLEQARSALAQAALSDDQKAGRPGREDGLASNGRSLAQRKGRSALGRGAT